MALRKHDTSPQQTQAVWVTKPVGMDGEASTTTDIVPGSLEDADRQGNPDSNPWADSRKEVDPEYVK